MILQRVCEEELLCAEELLEQGQLYRPNLHFEVFMRCIADLYDGESYELIALSSQYCSFQNVYFMKNIFSNYFIIRIYLYYFLQFRICGTYICDFINSIKIFQKNYHLIMVYPLFTLFVLLLQLQNFSESIYRQTLFFLFQEELVKFIKNGKNLVSPVLHVAFLDMVKNLCRCKSSANFLFELLLSTDYSKQGIVSYLRNEKKLD